MAASESLNRKLKSCNAQISQGYQGGATTQTMNKSTGGLESAGDWSDLTGAKMDIADLLANQTFLRHQCLRANKTGLKNRETFWIMRKQQCQGTKQCVRNEITNKRATEGRWSEDMIVRTSAY